MTDIIEYNVDELHFDYKNPRLAEFAEDENATDDEILKILWETMAVDEIVLSIAASGFFPHEQLIITEEITKGEVRNIVIEGNRRLAAVKAILYPNLIEGLHQSEIVFQVSDSIKRDLKKLPALKVKSREEAWKFIGFKHINGAAKWGSYAKAQYIAQIHKEFKISLSEIAKQIGDTNQTVQKLYQAYRAIEQAEQGNVFDRRDIWGTRLYFSHLSTGLGYENIQRYLDLKKENTEDAVEFPVPNNKINELGEVLGWMFGSKSKKISPVIQSQNPHLKQLNSVLKSSEATLLLKEGNPLIYAYEISQPKQDIFESSLVNAKKELQKAFSYSSIAYDGSIEPLKIAGDIFNLADALYEFMDNKREEIKKASSSNPKKRYTSE